MTLTTHHLSLTATATTPLELDDQAGAQIRGAIANALWGRFCANKAAPACAACPLLQVCPVASLVAPMREEGEKGGAQRPRPYVVRPPFDGPQRYQPGSELRFALSLFGHAAQLYPYIVMAAQALAEDGLGRRLPDLNGRRGQLRITAIDALNPLSGLSQPLYRTDSRHVQALGLPVTPADVAAFATTLPSDRLTLRFLTPLRLVDEDRLVHEITLRPLIQRLMRRLDDLSIAYGDGPLALDFRALLDTAAQVQIADNQTRWVDVVSFSSRQHRRTPIGGLVGHATFVGPLAPLRELLVWGSLIHVGRDAVKGNGAYRINDHIPT